MNQFKQQARQAGLLDQIDYFKLGTNYPNHGIITLEFDLYTDKAAEIESKIKSLQAPTDESSYQLAMQQIMAESNMTIGCDNVNDLHQAIEWLNQTPWQSIADLEQPMILNAGQEDAILYQSSENNLKLSQPSYCLEHPAVEERGLEPIFHYLATAIHTTAANIIDYQLAYYNLGDSYQNTTDKWSSINEFSVLEHIENDVQAKQIYAEVIESMKKSENLDRIAWRLQSFHYSTGQMDTPNIDYIIDDTGVLIGEKTWQKLATPDNITKMLSQISLTSN